MICFAEKKRRATVGQRVGALSLENLKAPINTGQELLFTWAGVPVSPDQQCNVPHAQC